MKSKKILIYCLTLLLSLNSVIGAVYDPNYTPTPRYVILLITIFTCIFGVVSFSTIFYFVYKISKKTLIPDLIFLFVLCITPVVANYLYEIYRYSSRYPL